MRVRCGTANLTIMTDIASFCGYDLKRPQSAVMSVCLCYMSMVMLETIYLKANPIRVNINQADSAASASGGSDSRPGRKNH